MVHPIKKNLEHFDNIILIFNVELVLIRIFNNAC